VSGHTSDRGTNEHLKAHHGGVRVSRKPEDWNVAFPEDSEGEWFGGSDGNLHPSCGLSRSSGKNRPDQVSVSDADPSTRDDCITDGSASVENLADRRLIVGCDTEVDRLPTFPFDQADEDRSVRVPYLAHPQRFIARSELVTGRDDTHTGPGVDRHPLQALACQ
jgi:hypothetical protein